MRDAQAPRGFPSPLWGGARGGGTPDLRGLGVPPTLSLPHKGGGDAAARSSHHFGIPGYPQRPCSTPQLRNVRPTGSDTKSTRSVNFRGQPSRQELPSALRFVRIVARFERQLVGHEGGGVRGLGDREVGRQVALQEAGALELG